MADSVTVNATLTMTPLTEGLPNVVLTQAAKLFNLSGVGFVQSVFSVPTTSGGTIIPLGGITTPGWYMIINNDTSNTVDILPATSGTATTSIPPGGIALGYFNSGVTAPALLAHTASVSVSYLISQR